MYSPVKYSLYQDEISEEVFVLTEKVLRKTGNYLERFDLIYPADRKYSPEVSKAVSDLIREHTCTNCSLIRSFGTPNRNIKLCDYMDMYPLKLKDFATEYDMIRAHLERSEKFYREIYCSFCGGMRGHTTKEEEADNFAQNYKKK
jgi:hypothetical protein